MKQKGDKVDRSPVEAERVVDGVRATVVEPEIVAPGLRGRFWGGWQCVPLVKPAVRDDFSTLGFVERGCCSLVYQTLKMEYWLSPGGGLRAWVRINMQAGVFLLVPVVVLLPVAIAFISGVATLSGYLMLVVRNLFLTLLYLVPVVLLLGSVVYMVCNGSRAVTKRPRGHWR